MAINLSDTKAQVRFKQGLQSAENDENFTKFEQRCENIYKFQFRFDPNTPWSNLGSDIERAMGVIIDDCIKDNLNLGDLRALSEWKLYQLHKTALKTNKNRSTKHAVPVAESSKGTSNPLTPMPEQGSSRAYDPVREAARGVK